MDAKDWDERYAATELVWSAEPNRFVAELVSPLTPGTAVDIAAGEGRNAIWLAQQGWTVTATDYSSVAVERMRAAGAVLIGLTTMPPMANGGMQRGVYGRAESPYDAEYLTAAYASGSSNGSAKYSIMRTTLPSRDSPIPT